MKRPNPKVEGITITLPALAWDYVLEVLAKQVGFVDGLPDLRPINVSGMIRFSIEHGIGKGQNEPAKRTGKSEAAPEAD